MKDVLERELNESEELALRETLETWKGEIYENMLEQVEVTKQEKIEELEESFLEFKEELKESYAEKMISALNEMREDIKAEVVSEMIQSNPELQVFESIKELIAPVLSEEYAGNLYSEQILNLKEENADLKKEIEIEEGAKTLAELISTHSTQNQKILISLISEGNSEEVTEQYFDLLESLNILEKEDEDEEEEEDEEDEEDEDGKKKKKKKKSDEDEDEEDDEEEDDEDVDEDFFNLEDDDSYINEDYEESTKKVANPLREQLKDLIK